MKNKEKEYFVEVVETESGEVVRRLGPMPRWKADKSELGLLINMNREKYHTRTGTDAQLKKESR